VLFWTDGQFSSESLDAFLVTVIWYGAVRVNDAGDARSELKWSALIGGALVCATFVRPTTYYFPLVGAALLAFALRRRPAARRGLAVLVLVAPSVLLCGGWQVRNAVTVGSWRFSGVEGYNVLAYDAAGVVARERGIAFNDAQDQVLADFGPPRPGERIGELDDRMYARGLEIVTQHPTTFVRTWARALLGVAFGVDHSILPLAGDWSPAGVNAVLHVALGTCWLLLLVGVVSGLRRRGHRAAHAWGAALLLYVVVVSAAGGGSYFRFRAPVAPIMCVEVAVGASVLLGRLGASSLKACIGR
jgi:hypothetical protein